MASVQDEVVKFLQGKGLSAAAIAGALGNMQIESGFNTGAANPREGAIGLVQWEGGRRTALQRYAAAHGMSETSLQAQLGYMWQELSGSYSGALAALRAARTPADAAAIWDGQYEISAGTTRQQRISAAQTFAASGLKGGGGGSYTPSADTLAAGGSNEAGSPSTKLTADDYKSALGSMSGLLTSVPELKGILGQAVSGGWTSTRFQNAIENTKWYKTHSDTVRQNLSLQASDPATFAKNMENQRAHIQQIADQLGVTLSSGDLASLTSVSSNHAWDDATLTRNIAYFWRQNNGKDATQSGQAAQARADLQKVSAAYGVPVGEAAMDKWTARVLSGQDTVDGFTESLKQQAKSMYPSIAKQIDQGLDVATIASPYMTTMSNLLELPPDQVTLSSPTIKKALQGTTQVSAGKDTSTMTPLWQFEQQVRKDPRWQYTTNAHQAVASMALQLGRDWGYAS